MDLEHAKALLSNVIDHVAVGNNTKETLKQLIFLGFTKEDLLEFQFCENDIDDAFAEYDSDDE